jgi:hypothetical protein
MPTTVKYSDFVDRYQDLATGMYPQLRKSQIMGLLALAWEDCSWSNLGDERVIRALTHAYAKRVSMRT